MTVRRSLNLLLLLLATAQSPAVHAQEEEVLRSTVAHVTRLAFTESLPEADRIELFALAVDWESGDPPQKIDPAELSKDRFRLRSFDGSLLDTDDPYLDVDAHVTLKGNRCKDIVDTWRKLKFRPNGALCHTPPYGIRVYKDDVLLFETTICWQCHNFYVPDYDAENGELKMIIYGFDDNANAKKLLNLFQRALPLKSKRKPSK